jgi:hypothetical protein
MDLAGLCVNGNALDQACQFNGQLIGNGHSIVTYLTSAVPAGSQCASQTRTCTNGVLSGSYTNLSCQVRSATTPTSPATPVTMPPLPCYLNGTRVESGSSITAFAAASATSCQSQQRQCTNGVLSGTYAFTSCMTLAASASCSFNGKSLMAGQTVTAYAAPAATATASCLSETRTCQARGVLSGSFAYASCTPYQSTPTTTTTTTTMPPKCTTTEALLTQRSFVQMLLVTPLDIAKSCVDAVIPTVEGSYPTNNDLYLRWVNTCGNRACIERGFISGRIAEINDAGIQLECRNDQVPPTVTDACRQQILALPKPIERIVMADTTVAQMCGLSSVPSGTDALINWVYTCGNRVCRAEGFSAGRVIEYYGGQSTLECAREEVVNTLQAGTLVQMINSTVEAVSTACVDAINPKASDSYPSNGAGQAIRFYNTCGRRYCIQQGYRTGRVTELSGSSVQLVCQK